MLAVRFALLICLFSLDCVVGAEDDLSDPVGTTGDTTGNVEATDQSEQTEDQFIRLQHTNGSYESVIKNLIQRIEHLEKVIDEQRPTPTDPEILERLQMESEENARLIQTAFEQRLQKEGSMLLGKSNFIYDLGLSFSDSSYDSVVVDGFTVYPVLVIGDIVSERVHRSTLTNNHSFRYGLGSSMQIDLTIPFSREIQDTFRDDGSHEEKKASELGDISLGFSYQLTSAHPGWPDSVLAFNWKTKTGDDPYASQVSGELAIGSGFNTFGLSLTSTANSDPTILFGGISANYTEDETKPIGQVNPGTSYGINLGMALALNFDTSMSFNFQYMKSEKTEIDGNNINGSNATTSTMSFGLSTAISDDYTIDVDIAIGLSAESPDFQLTVSFPLNFN